MSFMNPPVDGSSQKNPVAFFIIRFLSRTDPMSMGEARCSNFTAGGISLVSLRVGYAGR